MGIISKPNTFSANTAISSSQVNSDFDTIYNDYNGSISNANIATNAAIAGSKLADSGVTNTKLSTSAITLGYAERTSDFTTTTFSSMVDVTSLSVAVTVPSGGRRVKVTFFARYIASSQSAGNGVDYQILEGSTVKAIGSHTTPVIGYVETAICVASYVPAAGTYTYKVQAQQSAAGTLTVGGGATFPAFLLVELI